LVELLIRHGAHVNRPTSTGETPILQAAKGGNKELVDYLIKAGADFTAVDRLGNSAAYYAVLHGQPGLFALFNSKGASIYKENWLGISAVHLAMTCDGYTGFLLHLPCSTELTTPFPWNTVSLDAEPAWIGKHFGLYLKRIGRARLQMISNLEPNGRFDWSALCLMAVEGHVVAMENLIDLGASLDHEGSPHGSALMTACAYGQLSCAKYLVRKGASLSYTSSTQGHMSCLTAARGSPTIIRWLLVGRFTEQNKIAQPCEDIHTAEYVANDSVKHWSGIVKAELVITGSDERLPSESSREYFTRLQDLRRRMNGKQLPPRIPGRRTCRPSRLIPMETVHISPSDKRVPE
jgi:hypothetical protein